jgi:hypothetical protein
MRACSLRSLVRPLWLVPALLLASTPALLGAPGAAPSCGDGLFTVGETCASCPADCTPKACTADAKTLRRYTMQIAPPLGQVPTGFTALVSYRSGVLSVPGKADDKSVSERVQRQVNADLLVVRDADYAMSITLGMTNGLPSGPLVEIDFDTCKGAPTPGPNDVTCEVVGCAGIGGPLTGCNCEIKAM